MTLEQTIEKTNNNLHFANVEYQDAKDNSRHLRKTEMLETIDYYKSILKFLNETKYPIQHKDDKNQLRFF